MYYYVTTITTSSNNDVGQLPNKATRCHPAFKESDSVSHLVLESHRTLMYFPAQRHIALLFPVILQGKQPSVLCAAFFNVVLTSFEASVYAMSSGIFHFKIDDVIANIICEYVSRDSCRLGVW